MVRKFLHSDKEIFKKFIEKSLRNSPEGQDEGIGTIYERVVLDAYFRSLVHRYHIETVLEHPADGVTGILGINSLEFARNGCKVFLSNPILKVVNQSLEIWRKNHLQHNVRVFVSDIDSGSLKDNCFDLVWNYCVFERFKSPSILLREMARISKRFILIMTQNRFNLGIYLHHLYHHIARIPWDHGYQNLMSLNRIIKICRAVKIKVLEYGTIDIPPWVDIWDMPIRGQIKKMFKPLGLEWQWALKSGEDSGTKQIHGKVLRLLADIESRLPFWFSKIHAHHFYVLGQI